MGLIGLILTGMVAICAIVVYGMSYNKSKSENHSFHATAVHLELEQPKVSQITVDQLMFDISEVLFDAGCEDFKAMLFMRAKGDSIRFIIEIDNKGAHVGTSITYMKYGDHDYSKICENLRAYLHALKLMGKDLGPGTSGVFDYQIAPSKIWRS